MIDLTISIVSWNTRHLLEKCLRSVYACVQNNRFEVFVVDNGSSDGSAEMVKNKFPQVKLIQNVLNPGFAAANNQAIRQSRGRYILILNSDTTVQTGSLDAPVAFLDANTQAGAVGVKTFRTDGSVQPTWGGFPSLWSELWGRYTLRGIPVKVPVGNGVYKEVLDTDSLAGSYLMVRREAIDKVGLMDESFYMYSEEVDWCFRLRKKGYKIYYLPYVHIIHCLGQSTKQREPEMKAQLYRSKLKFFRKHYGRASERLLYLGLRTVFISKMAAFSITYILTFGRHTALISRAKIYRTLLKGLEVQIWK